MQGYQKLYSLRKVCCPSLWNEEVFLSLKLVLTSLKEVVSHSCFGGVQEGCPIAPLVRHTSRPLPSRVAGMSVQNYLRCLVITVKWYSSAIKFINLQCSVHNGYYKLIYGQSTLAQAKTTLHEFFAPGSICTDIIVCPFASV